MTISINLEWLLGRMSFHFPGLFKVDEGHLTVGVIQLILGFIGAPTLGGLAIVLLVMLVIAVSIPAQTNVQNEGFSSPLMGGFVPPLDPSECAAAVQKLPPIPRQLYIGGIAPDPQQLTNACIIIGEVNREKLPAKASIIAIAAAMVESGVRNLPYGDRDSVGLFQERPSQGWGSRLQILNQQYATMKFLEKLKAVPNWQNQPVGAMAQAVERSAFPARYAEKESVASAWVAFFSATPALITAGAAGAGPGPQVKLVASAKGSPFGNQCKPVVTQGYGETTLALEPVDPKTNKRVHHGVDLSCPDGTPILSVTEGIAHVTLGFGGGYGNNVVVETMTTIAPDPAPHKYFIRYAHMKDGSVKVQDGAQVMVGTVLGQEGSTGSSTGSHLHFEVDKDSPLTNLSVDPTPLLSI